MPSSPRCRGRMPKRGQNRWACKLGLDNSPGSPDMFFFNILCLLLAWYLWSKGWDGVCHLKIWHWGWCTSLWHWVIDISSAWVYACIVAYSRFEKEVTWNYGFFWFHLQLFTCQNFMRFSATNLNLSMLGIVVWTSLCFPCPPEPIAMRNSRFVDNLLYRLKAMRAPKVPSLHVIYSGVFESVPTKFIVYTCTYMLSFIWFENYSL